MDFRKATDGLFEQLGHSDLAGALGVSVASIRQARLSHDAKAFRNPPDGWEPVVAKMAQYRADKLLKLARALRERSGN